MLTRKQENDHVYAKPMEFLIDTVPQRYHLSKIFKTPVLLYSEIPCVDMYLQIIVSEEPNDSFARVIIGASFGRAKMLERIQAAKS